MASPSSSVVALPPSVESLLRQICADQCQSPPDASIRWMLDRLGEETSLHILGHISGRKIYKTLSAYIAYMAKPHLRVATEESVNLSPSKRSTGNPGPVNSPNGFGSHSPLSKRPLFSPSSNSTMASSSTREISPQLSALSDLEFRKAFLILSYIGREKLEDLMSVHEITRLKDLPMRDFETRVWDAVGNQCIDKEDRRKYVDWDSGKTYLYHCHVHQDGSYTFKGPYLGYTRTHLQRVFGDDNVLIVKFAIEATNCTNKRPGSSNYDAVFNKVAKEGILVGLRRYRFFVFKDGGKEEKKKSSTSSSVKCFFTRVSSLAPCDEREPYIFSNKTIYEARSLFMHVHTVSSMEKYMARLSLILSATIKHPVDPASICINDIVDTPCRDENGCVVNNDDGKPLIHTDGTGYISEDLALLTPKGFSRAKYINDGNFERFLDGVNCEEKSRELRRSEAHSREPPLLMQVRLFYEGRAVKGTLLVNRKLPKETIVVRRRSMIKVERDSRLQNAQTFNSLEIVGISNKPKKAILSRNLIALLSYGGVPREYFLDILANALEDSQSAYSNKRAALRVALNRGEVDDDFNVARMILSGVPLNEPHVQHRMSEMTKEERKGLKGGKLPISESFYLMGTTDPTGMLESHQVCVILDNGQISGDVLVYRNPGLHFGDIHRLKAVYVEALNDIVGNAKYGIFFSIKGKRSVASEIANGDFDGDVYWVSRNPQLLDSFRPSKPWERIYSIPSVPSKKPNELSEEELEHELFELFKRTMFQRSNPMSVAADSWSAYMDRLLILGDGCSDEKDNMKRAMQRLIDTYYDALDAPKSGKKVVVPDELRAEKYPHYMERPNSYNSTSVLGLIYDSVVSFISEDHSAEDVEVWKLPCFDVDQIPRSSLDLWSKRYDDYRREMSDALKSDKESKNDAANTVTMTYKRLLYGAAEFEESERNIEDVYNDALAIYNVTYDYAKSCRDVGKCRFAWKVAGPALCKLHALKQSDEKVERPIVCLPSVLKEVMN